MKRILIACAAAAAIALALSAQATDMNKTLRIAFLADVTGFDPQAGNDAYSGYVNNEMFDTMYVFDYYVRPFKIVGSIAESLPEISADGLTWKIKIRAYCL